MSSLAVRAPAPSPPAARVSSPLRASLAARSSRARLVSGARSPPAARRGRGRSSPPRRVASASFSAPVPGRPAADPPAPPEGVGFAMARAFLRRGDRVCVCGRSQTRVDDAVTALRAEFPGACVSGRACDVTDPRDVDAFGDYAASTVGVIHHWLNNAGVVAPREPLMSVEPGEIVKVSATNMTGTLLCCQKAVRVMQRQPGGIGGGSEQRFPINKEGAAAKPPKPPNTGTAAGPKDAFGALLFGSTPRAPPQLYHVYNFGFSRWGASFSKSTCSHKATKRGVAQLTQSLSEELLEAGVDAVGVHQLSPGMVLTDLLLEGADPTAKRFFNVLAEEPETVAEAVVPRIRATRGTNTAIEFLPLPEAIRRVVTGVPQILGPRGRHFENGSGRRIEETGKAYKENGVKLLYDEMK